MTTSEASVLEKRSSSPQGYLFSHCILNMNTRAPGISIWSGAVLPILEVMEEIVDRVHQLPCHEEYYMGSNRWWQVYNQYSHSLFREKSRLISESYVSLMKREGYSSVKVLGLGLSPTCGVRETQIDESWGGRPRDVDTTRNVGIGKGVFMEVLESVLQENGFQALFHDLSPSLIYPGKRVEATKSYPRSPVASLMEVCSFLEVPCNYKYPKERLNRIETIANDARSKKNIVIPHSMMVSSYHKVVEKAYEGYGLIVVDDFCFDEEKCAFMSSVYSHMLRNLLAASHKIVYVLPPSPELDFLESILDNIGSRSKWPNFKLSSEL